MHFLVAERTGLEPATPGVTGRYSNQLNYRSRSLWWVLRGSNSRHSPCKGDALPTELSTRRSRETSASLPVRDLEIWRKCRCAVQRSALVYCILECFSSAELGHLGRLDLDGRAGAGIAAAACRALADVESAETDQRHHPALLQRALDRRN